MNICSVNTWGGEADLGVRQGDHAVLLAAPHQSSPALTAHHPTKCQDREQINLNGLPKQTVVAPLCQLQGCGCEPGR